MADLDRLELLCSKALGTVTRGNKNFACLHIASITCSGLDEKLQDKLDDAIAQYAVSVRELCYAMAANSKVKPAQLPEYTLVGLKLDTCRQVISECKQALQKKPTVLDQLLTAGSRGAQTVANRVTGTAALVAGKVKSAASFLTRSRKNTK